MPKSKRIRDGQYAVTVHGHVFTLEKPFGGNQWTLCNADGTELCRCETKAGALQLMATWSADYTAKQSAADFCDHC